MSAEVVSRLFLGLIININPRGLLRATTLKL
jgi:hypothetical protein